MISPVALARAQAMALVRTQPIKAWVRGWWFSVSWQISSRMLPVIFTVTIFPLICTSVFSASSTSSTSSLGSFVCSWVRSVSVNDLPLFCSSSLQRPAPVGVRNTPSLFTLSSLLFTSSGLGRTSRGFSGMNTTLESVFFMFLGGKYTPGSVIPNSVIRRSMLLAS